MPGRIRGISISRSTWAGSAPRSRAARRLALSVFDRMPMRNRAFMGAKEMLCMQMTPRAL